MKPLTSSKRRCIIEATIDPLMPFPRGFARSNVGPFFELRTVHSLIRSGDLRMVHMSGKGRGRHGVQVTARTA